MRAGAARPPRFEGLSARKAGISSGPPFHIVWNEVGRKPERRVVFERMVYIVS